MPGFLFYYFIHLTVGFPDSSVGKESACIAGYLGQIPGLRRSSGEGIGYLLKYLGASLLAQLVKNPPAKQETWLRSLGWEDPLAKGKTTHSSILVQRIPWTIQSSGLQKVGKQLSLSLSCGMYIPEAFRKVYILTTHMSENIRTYF